MNKAAKILIGIAFLAAATLVCILLDLTWIDGDHRYTFSQVIDTLLGGGTWGSRIIILDTNAPRGVARHFV